MASNVALCGSGMESDVALCASIISSDVVFSGSTISSDVLRDWKRPVACSGMASDVVLYCRKRQVAVAWHVMLSCMTGRGR